jgi:hypothetical protein
VVDSDGIVESAEVVESDGVNTEDSGFAGEGVTTMTVDCEAVLVYSEVSGATPLIQEVVSEIMA